MFLVVGGCVAFQPQQRGMAAQQRVPHQNRQFAQSRLLTSHSDLRPTAPVQHQHLHIYPHIGKHPGHRPSSLRNSIIKIPLIRGSDIIRVTVPQPNRSVTVHPIIFEVITHYQPQCFLPEQDLDLNFIELYFHCNNYQTTWTAHRMVNTKWANRPIDDSDIERTPEYEQFMESLRAYHQQRG